MIINLTQHTASAEQIAAGVQDLPAEQRGALVEALTFESLPTADEILAAAEAVAELAVAELAVQNGLGDDCLDSPAPESAMIGGALWLMAPLADALRRRGVQPLFAFSQRESVESAQSDGSVRKTTIFRHVGFVPAV